MNFGEKVLAFLESLQLKAELPPDVKVMNPFNDLSTLEVCRQFYLRYYGDNDQRRMIIGINPGRFGGGITGIPFTDPIRLQGELGIANPWPRKQELSSLYMYNMINSFGGAEAFYKQYYFTSISPLGFTKNDKNLNYYDDRQLQESIKAFVIAALETQLGFGIHRNAAFCLGEGKNYAYLSKLNNELKIFDTIVPLSHPRFIMQYRLKRKDEFISHYLEQFKLYC